MISVLHRHNPQDPALISGGDGQVLNYEQLLSLVDANRTALAAIPRPALAMLSCRDSVASVVAYLSCLAAEIPVCLAEPGGGAMAGLVGHYRPSLLLLPADGQPPEGYRELKPLAAGDYRFWIHPERSPYPQPLHESLCVLLCTSGSTGSPKLVRLTEANLVANAAAIASYLQLGPGERAVQSLPMQYAYGLSLIHSHLYAGGAVVFNPHSFMELDFWTVFDRTACTSFAGVPYMYELLLRLNIQPAARTTLRTLTQAGGGLSRELTSAYHQAARQYGKRFFVMYGQTEATARMAYVPPDRLGEKLGAAGIPVPGGCLRLEAVAEVPEARQLVYQGPNVMLGYARGPEDLSLGDVQRGVLHTGDLGRADADGYFYVVGRINRIAKVFGRRVNLLDIENEVERSFPCRAVAVDRRGKIVLYLQPHDWLDPMEVRRHVARLISARPHAIGVELIERIPLTPAGKKDYHALSPQAVAACV